MRKTRLLILIIVATLLLVSCDKAIYGFYSDSEKELYNKVTWFEDENGNRTLVYNGLSYYYDEFGFFSVWENYHFINDGDIMLGWTGSPSGLFYTQEYYSYMQNAPLFIYNLRVCDVYFYETYDYRFDTFIIEGTNSKIIFSDAVKEKPAYELHLPNESYIITTNVILRSETNSRVISKLSLHVANEIWYVSTRNCYYFEITNEFKQLLIENNIIEIENKIIEI